jgi:hypothetical protein
VDEGLGKAADFEAEAFRLNDTVLYLDSKIASTLFTSFLILPACTPNNYNFSVSLTLKNRK